MNPGVVTRDGRVLLVYRAVGSDGLSRLGIAWSQDGFGFSQRGFLHEGAPGDRESRLGVEDPRLVTIGGDVWMTYTCVSVSPVGTPPLEWEPAPFELRMRLARIAGSHVDGERSLLPEVHGKDAVLFPRRIGDRYHALVRVYPSLQLSTSEDLVTWSPPRPVLHPVPGTWEGERIGAGPPPVDTPYGWLMLYHANEFYVPEGNRRCYRAGIALLDRDDPARVLYRHPAPVFEPRATYEVAGPVGNVVFPTGLIQRDGQFLMYYGAGDGVIGVASAAVGDVYSLLEQVVDARAAN
jgi:predicted GH43/DUF377 family glycosyl hydrolase